MANFTGLAAARHEVLRRAGWDVETGGLSGAPRGPRARRRGPARHHRPRAALPRPRHRRDRRRSTADDQGRMRVGRAGARARRDGAGPTIVCAQVGNVNTGAVDPIGEICDLAHAAGAWVHVDGAFGLWAAASPRCGRCWTASSGPTRGRPTRTSGSTSRTTPGWSSAPTRRRTGPRWACAPATSSTPTAASATRWTTTRSSPGGPAASPSTRRCGRSAAAASPRWSTRLLRAGPPVRRPARRRRRRRGAQRRRAQPGARAVPRFDGDHDDAHPRGDRRACSATAPAG